MKVRLLSPAMRGQYGGSEVELEAAVAERLIARGVAVEVKARRAPKKKATSARRKKAETADK